MNSLSIGSVDQQDNQERNRSQSINFGESLHRWLFHFLVQTLNEVARRWVIPQSLDCKLAGPILRYSKLQYIFQSNAFHFNFHLGDSELIANAVEAFASSIRFDTRKLFSSVWNVQTNDNSIAFVTSFPNSWWGGCEDLWCATATLLANEGSFKVFASVNSYSRLPQPLVQLQSAGCKLSQKQHSRFSGPFGSYEKRWLKARKPKLVVVSEGETFEGRLWMNACRELGIRFVTLSHASSSWSWPFDGSNESLRQNYLAAEHCFFVCRENLELLEMKIASKLACASVVRNPFRVPYQSTLKWPDSGGKLRLACVATSEPHRKGQDLLFRVLAKPKWQERSLEVTLYCGGGDREALLRQMAHALKLKNVEFVGWVDEVASIWRDNHGLLLPDLYRDFGLSGLHLHL